MKLLNIHDVKQVFGVKSRQTIYNWIENGNLPEPLKKWGSPRWNESEIMNSLEKQGPNPDPKPARK